MVCLLTLNPFVTTHGVANAATETFSESAQASLEVLIDKQGSLKGYGAQENFKNHAAEIAEEGQEFIASLKDKDKDILKTPAGAKFLNEHSRLSRIQALKERMNKCAEGLQDKRGLTKQILNSTENSEYTGGCDRKLTRTKNGLIVNSSLKDFISDLGETQKFFDNGKSLGPAGLQESLHMQALKNSLKSYLSLRYKYEPGFINPETGEISNASKTVSVKNSRTGKVTKRKAPSDLQQTLNDMCGKESSHKVGGRGGRGGSSTRNYCSASQRAELTKYTQEASKEVAFTQKKSDWGTALTNVRGKFKDLNDKYLDKVDLKTDYSGIDGADIQDKTAKGAWNKYKLQYLKDIQSQDGLLMMSPNIKEKSGGIRRLETDTTNDEGFFAGEKNFYVKPHKYKNISEDDLKEGKKQIQDKIVAQAKLLNQMAHNKQVQEKRFRANGSPDDSWTGVNEKDLYEKRKEDIVKLVKTNPAAAGQILVNEPQWADLVCAAIKTIDKNDISDAKWDKVWMVGGLIVAGVVIVGGALLMATGLGAPLGAAAIGSGLTLGSAATATVLVIGAAEATYWGTRTYDHHKEHQELEMAVLSGNNEDPESVERAYADFKDARFNFLMSLPAVILPGVGKIASLSKGSKFTASVGKMSGAAKAKFLNKMSYFYKQLGKSKKLRTFMDKLISSGRLKADKIHEFVEMLSKTKGKINEKFLTWLKAKIPDPTNKGAYEKFLATVHKIIDEGLDAATKACKL